MGVSGGPNIVRDSSLVLELDAADRNSYVSGSTTWFDLSNSLYNGTLINGPTFNSANGGSIVFDGADDYVETNYVPASSTSFTVMAWAKSTSSGVQNRLLGNADSLVGSTGMDIIWGYSVANKIYVVRRTGNNLDIESTAIANLATGWHHIAHSYNHTTVGGILYVDNIQVGTNTNLGFLSTLTFRIGRDGNGTDRFNGNVANVLLYNRALSAQEIQQNYNVQKSRFNL